MITAIVLAAGSSVRMKGTNKLLLPYKNTTIIEHVISELTASGIKEILVITGFEYEKISTMLKSTGVTCIYNPDHLIGLTSGIKKGIPVAKGHGLLICLADMVTLTKDDYMNLIKGFNQRFSIDQECICVPVFNNQKGNPVIFSAHYKNEILNHTAPDGCKQIVLANKKHVYVIQMNTDHVLNDIDYPEDYDRIIK